MMLVPLAFGLVLASAVVQHSATLHGCAMECSHMYDWSNRTSCDVQLFYICIDYCILKFPG